MSKLTIQNQIYLGNGWKNIQLQNWSVNYSGDINHQELSAFLRTTEQDKKSEILKNFPSNFAFVARGQEEMLMAVDVARTIPLFYFLNQKLISVTNLPSRFFQDCPELYHIDPIGKLFMSMSGYVIGESTLVKNFHSIRAGELIQICAKSNEIRKKMYHSYRPWNRKQISKIEAQIELEKITTNIFEKIIDKANGRKIAIPLSAGYDSRLVASCLKKLNYKNVFCFAYGHPGNFEAKISKFIAEKLGYQWMFIPTGLREQKRFIKTETFKNYLKYIDSFESTPFEQDAIVIHELMTHKILSPGDIIINGNTGDYISGGHLPPKDPDKMNQNPKQYIVDAYLKKHASLWSILRNQENDGLITKAIEEEIAFLDVHVNETNAPLVFEAIEFYNRQTKYVISGQRCYDFFGINWELPLWNKSYINFWEKIPLEFKYNQYLYKEMLHNTNWGGVWKMIPVNRKKISPSWVVPLRILVKLIIFPLGAKVWHKIEKQLFFYPTELLGLCAHWNYFDIFKDRRGFRNIVSWLTDKYLKNKGLSIGNK